MAGSGAPLTIPVRCQRCGQAAALTYTSSAETTIQRWRCPYDGCHASNQVNLDGTDLMIVARYDPRDMREDPLVGEAARQRSLADLRHLLDVLDRRIARMRTRGRTAPVAAEEETRAETQALIQRLEAHDWSD